MKSDKVVYWSIAFVIIMMLVWTTVVICSVGPDSVWAIISGESKTQIESFGQLGASYGVLAALFAGIAVVMLRHSISVQQKELTQLKEQMEHDRDINNFKWILDAFMSARLRLSMNIIDQQDIKSHKKDQYTLIQSDEFISHIAMELLDMRRNGIYDECDTYDGMIENFILNKFSFVNSLSKLVTYNAALVQVVKYIYIAKGEVRNRYTDMFASVTSWYDLFLIHEHAILRDESRLIEMLESTGLLGVHGSDLYEEISGGPRLKPSAFGIK